MFPHRIAGTVVNPTIVIISMSICVIVRARTIRTIVISNFTAITIDITAIVSAAILASGNGICAIISRAGIVPIFFYIAIAVPAIVQTAILH
jgi:hypothetical protein